MNTPPDGEWLGRAPADVERSPAVDVGLPTWFEIPVPRVKPVGGRSKRRRLGIVLLVVAVFVGGMIFDRVTLPTVEDPAEFAMITEAWTLLHDEYVEADEMDPSALAHGAIAGMAYGVGDTGHTYFLTPAEAAVEAQLSENGWYGGIGLDIDYAAAVPTIASLDASGPAAEAGLHVGDRILAVDGRSTTGAGRELALDSITGMPRTVVVLKIEHPERGTTVDVSVTRAEIGGPAVEWAMVPGRTVAMIKLNAFIDGSGDDVAAAIRDAMEAGASSLVLDLRGNPGGLSEEAVAVASLFLHRSDVIIVERDADGIETPTKSSTGPVAPDLPLAVLVDSDSASSSEAVMGALQDAGRAIVVGSRTAGTGTTMYGWTFDDESELWIGTTRWFTPSGRSAWHVGLEPDVVVALPDGRVPVEPGDLAGLGAAGLAASGDAQLLRALKELEPGR